LLDSEPNPERTKQLRPPTRRSSWYERFFELLASRKINLVDADFVKVNITPDRSDAGRFTRGLRFLGLIDENGKTTRQMDKLRLTGDEFKKNLGDVIRSAYSMVFDVVHLETAKRQYLVNFFIEKYGLSADVATDAVEMFVYFANRAEIPVSDDLKTVPLVPRQPKDENQRKSTVPKKVTQQAKQIEEIPEGWIELRLENVRIWLPKDDRSAAEAAKRLLDLHLETHHSND
jgi:hypothetical protein